MAYTYQADVWCTSCGQAIIAGLEILRTVPENPEDESSFDSDEYPKHYDPENEESDGPENCADGNCAGEYGTFLENRLTQEGYRYLKSMLDGHGATLPEFAKEWADFYQFEYHDNPWSSASEWLQDTIQRHAAQIQDWNGGNTHSTALMSFVTDILLDLPPDTIQDRFQSDMDDDGFFKESGWYSPEMEGD